MVRAAAMAAMTGLLFKTILVSGAPAQGSELPT